MIVGLMLPEGFACSAQQMIRVTNGIRRMPRDSRIAQPERPTLLVQGAILRCESMTGRRINDVSRLGRQRPVQPPCDKQILTVRLKVR